MTRYDVAIAGAGPAGSGIAALLAERGLRVALVDRARFPRPKVCGEFLAADGVAVLERWGVLDELTGGGRDAPTTISRCRIAPPRGAAIETELPAVGGRRGHGLGVSRARLDDTLLRRAIARGAVFHDRCRVLGPRVVDDRARGLRFRPAGRSRAIDLDAVVTIGADGRRSAVARALARRGDPESMTPRSWFGLQAHFDGAPDAIDGHVELHVFDGGYAGLARIEGGRANLAMLVRVEALRAAGGRADRLLVDRVRADSLLGRRTREIRRTSRWKGVGPLRFGGRRAAAAGALFLGDAAGTIDPFAGEGIAHALRSAEIAVPFAARAVVDGGVTPATARAWAHAWHGAFAATTRRNRALSLPFRNPALAAAAVTALRAGPSWAFAALVRASRSSA